MYDTFQVPASVTELRLITLEGWNLNANVNGVLSSTSALGQITITKAKHNANKKQLEINFEVTPTTEQPALVATEEGLANFPPLAKCVPPVGGEDLDDVA